MIVKNLTPHKVKVDLKSILGSHEEYSINIVPYGATEISELEIITNRAALGDSISLGDEVAKVVIPETPKEIEETPAVEEKEPEKLESKFICEECGAEFASARSLAAHISRSHKN